LQQDRLGIVWPLLEEAQLGIPPFLRWNRLDVLEVLQLIDLVDRRIPDLINSVQQPASASDLTIR
jgi:hypothetical protein